MGERRSMGYINVIIVVNNPELFLTHSFSNSSLQSKETYANYIFMKTREHNNLENIIFIIQHYTRKFICTIEKMRKIVRNLQSKETIKQSN